MAGVMNGRRELTKLEGRVGGIALIVLVVFCGLAIRAMPLPLSMAGGAAAAVLGACFMDADKRWWDFVWIGAVGAGVFAVIAMTG